MAIAGSIIVNVLAKTDQFVRGMGKSQTALRGFSKGLTTFLGPLGLAGSVAGLAALAKGVIDSTDTLSKKSKLLNISTEALASYRFALESTAGMAAGQFDVALQRMTRRIGQAAMGAGEAKKFLDAWGLSAQNLTRMSSDAQFDLITQQIAGMSTQSERLAAAMGFFDSEGAGIATNIRAIAKEAKAFREFGFAPTQEQAARLEQFSQTLTDLKVFATGEFTRLLIELAVAFKTFTEGLRDALRAYRELNEAVKTATSPGGVSARSAADRILENAPRLNVEELRTDRRFTDQFGVPAIEPLPLAPAQQGDLARPTGKPAKVTHDRTDPLVEMQRRQLNVMEDINRSISRQQPVQLIPAGLQGSL